jgi:hypothetical protein
MDGQITYDRKAAAAVAGMESDSAPSDDRSATGPTAASLFAIEVATIQNSTLYRITVTYLSKAAATYGQTVNTNIDYTSDGSATKPEILAGLLAQVALTVAPVVGQVDDATNGFILLQGKTFAQDFTVTVSANLTASTDAGEIPFGVLVCADGTEEKARLPQVIADVTTKALGVALRTLAQENNLAGTNVYPKNARLRVRKKGRVWVKVEEAVAAFDKAWVRLRSVGNNTQRGAFRKSGDGTAQVVNFAPGEANATPYVVSLGQYSYSYLSDGSGTDAEIIAGFILKINEQTALHGVTASDGTTTLTLTGIAGVPFDYSASANMVATLTTAAVPAAAELPRATYRTAASANGLALLELDL